MKIVNHLLKLSLLAVISSVIVACGGGAGGTGPSSGAGTGTGSTTITPIISELEVSSSAAQLDSNGSTSAIITVTAKNADNAVVPGVVVTFKASSGNLVIDNSTTDASGRAKATLTVGSNKANRIITVSILGDKTPASVDVEVKGTTLTVSGPSAIGLNTPVQLLASLKDSSGTPIPGVPVNFSSTLGNGVAKTCVPSSCVTDTSGSLIINYSPTIGGQDTISLAALNATSTQVITAATSAIVISVASDGAAYPVNEFVIGQTNKVVNVTLIGASSYPATVNLSSTAGSISPSTVIVPSSGAVVSANLATNSSVGQGVIYAQHAVTNGVSNTFPFEIVSRVPSSVTLQASPSVVSINAGTSTQNKSTVTATVRDTAGNPVKGAAVVFSMTSNTSGGSLQSATATTNSSGLATTNYIAGPNSAANTGVAIYATVAGTIVSPDINITVSAQSLYVNVGFANVLIPDSPTRYSKSFSVSVTDASGAAVPGATVSVALQPLYFYKGQMVLVGSDGGAVTPANPATKFGRYTTAVCLNEDANFNGNIEGSGTLITEDINGNGRLDPGVRPVISQTSTTAAPNTTDQSGFVDYKMSYFKQDALWSEYRLVVTTSTANGANQGRATQNYQLQVLVDDVSDPNVAPPNPVSPFGRGISCSDVN
jgi:Bacterial Ig-like domain (group 1)